MSRFKDEDKELASHFQRGQFVHRVAHGLNFRLGVTVIHGVGFVAGEFAAQFLIYALVV